MTNSTTLTTAQTAAIIRLAPFWAWIESLGHTPKISVEGEYLMVGSTLGAALGERVWISIDQDGIACCCSEQHSHELPESVWALFDWVGRQASTWRLRAIAKDHEFGGCSLCRDLQRGELIAGLTDVRSHFACSTSHPTLLAAEKSGMASCSLVGRAWTWEVHEATGPASPLPLGEPADEKLNASDLARPPRLGVVCQSVDRAQ